MFLPAFLGGHSTASPGLSVVFIVLALVLFMMRARARGGGRGPFGGGRYGGGGPWGGGSSGSQRGGSPPDEPPVQWDIRKPDRPSEGAPGDAPAEGPTDVQNPPSDL